MRLQLVQLTFALSRGALDHISADGSSALLGGSLLHVALISCLSLDGGGNILVGERFQGGLLSRAKNPAREAPEQKCQRSLFGFAVREHDRHHTLGTSS